MDTPSSPLLAEGTLARQPGAFRAISLFIPLQVAFATHDGEIDTLEGMVRYQTGDAIITGTRGEQWPVRRVEFLARYIPQAPTLPGQNGVYGKHPRQVWALLLDAPIAIELSGARGILRGKQGDLLVEYAPGDQAIVNGAVFSSTYRRLD
jgi:hypothetical protein